MQKDGLNEKRKATTSSAELENSINNNINNNEGDKKRNCA